MNWKRRKPKKFPAGLIDYGNPIVGGNNVIQFQEIDESSDFAKMLPGVKYIMKRTPIEGAPVLDPQRWTSWFIDHQLVPKLAEFAPQYILPRIFLDTPKMKNEKVETQKAAWYRIEHGTSLSDQKRFPEGKDFPDQMFTQMVGLFPTLAQWTDQLPKSRQPKTFTQHLQDELGISTITIDNKIWRKATVGAIDQHMIQHYLDIIKGLSWQHTPSIDMEQATVKYHELSNNNQLDHDGQKAKAFYNHVYNLLYEYDWKSLSYGTPNNLYTDYKLNPYSKNHGFYLPSLLDDDFPDPEDTTNYAKNVLGKFTEEDIYQKYQHEFDDEDHLFTKLCDELGIPKRPLDLFYDKAKDLHPRPFMYTHGDLHRKNLMKAEDGRLIILDWDTLDWRDWVFDAVKHTKKIRYTADQKESFWHELLEGNHKMPDKYITNIEEIKQDIPIYDMYLNIDELIVMLIRSTMMIAKGEMKRDDPGTQRNLQKLVNALKTAKKDPAYRSRTNEAGKHLEGWERAETDSENVYAKIEAFVERTNNRTIKKMREQRDQADIEPTTRRRIRPPDPARTIIGRMSSFFRSRERS